MKIQNTENIIIRHWFQNFGCNQNNSLISFLDAENCELSDIVLTHWHPDHVGGVQDILR